MLVISRVKVPDEACTFSDARVEIDTLTANYLSTERTQNKKIILHMSCPRSERTMCFGRREDVRREEESAYKVIRNFFILLK